MRRRAKELLAPRAADRVAAARSEEATALWLAGGMWTIVCVIVARLDLGGLASVVDSRVATVLK